jgi:hypothetical protein
MTSYITVTVGAYPIAKLPRKRIYIDTTLRAAIEEGSLMLPKGLGKFSRKSMVFNASKSGTDGASILYLDLIPYILARRHM